MDRDGIIKAGKVDLLVLHSGMRQKIEFRVVPVQLPTGKIPVLKTEREVSAPELFRLAKELDLPIEGSAGRFFAPGRKAGDYVGLLA